ncbi:TolB family protein [Hazenella coriacea]|uniref:WD40 repeat protein n=1 Tax=Hazenella coriacea TaxID=1179467 RepID=A0A4V2UUU0_9BACL|nr:DPP IV N-terminal domain-containing protein [Hazenella coriacea]TCS93147.1 WD40 repeat protein [Hazenella coriacea]
MRKTVGIVCAFILSSSLLLPNSVHASDSKQIFFSGGPLYKTGIYKMSEETTKMEKVLDGNYVDVSPDGKKLAFIKEDSLYISQVDGKNLVRLTNNQFPVYDASPRWSPNSKKIVFSRSDGNIYTIQVDSKKITNLTKTDETIINSEPDWSPDGSKIIFHSNRTDRSHLYVMNANGSNVKQLTGLHNDESSEYSAHFSPNGKKIIFGRAGHGNADIYIMNADGSSQINLTKDFDQAVATPIWSPDGKKILYTINNPEDSSNSSLYTMNPNGSGKAKMKLDLPYANPYAWQSVEVKANDEKSGFEKTIDYISNLFF